MGGGATGGRDAGGGRSLRLAAALGGDRGTAIAVVLWALVALGALSAAAAVVSITDLALARAHRDHAAALGLAEAGLAETLARLAADPAGSARPDSFGGTLTTGAWSAVWFPSIGGGRALCEGDSRGMRRRIEARVTMGQGGEVRITAWREVL